MKRFLVRALDIVALLVAAIITVNMVVSGTPWIIAVPLAWIVLSFVACRPDEETEDQR